MTFSPSRLSQPLLLESHTILLKFVHLGLELEPLFFRLPGALRGIVHRAKDELESYVLHNLRHGLHIHRTNVETDDGKEISAVADADLVCYANMTILLHIVTNEVVQVIDDALVAAGDRLGAITAHFLL